MALGLILLAHQPKKGHPMSTQKFLRGASAILALTAAAFALNARRQSANPTGPANTNSNQAGEAYPQRPERGQPQQAEDGRHPEGGRIPSGASTKRVAKKTKKAVKKTGHKAADAMRNTGDKIGRKLPPAPQQPSGVKP
jgi:hypothetical protein